MKTLWIVLLSLCVGALLSGMLMRSCQTPQIERVEIVKTDTLTITKVDTIEIVKPQPYKVEVRDTIYIDKEYSGHVFVQETKWFSDNKTYDMKVSGINVQLDYIRTYAEKETQYITITEKVYTQPQKLSLWLNADYMYMGKKSHLPISGELKYAENEYREYKVKVGSDVISGQLFVLAGTSVKLF